MRTSALVLAFAVGTLSSLTGCAARREKPTPVQAAPSLDALAGQYVKLVLAVGQHDPDYVDAFYGPKEWAEEAKREKLPLAEIRARAERLTTGVEAVPEPTEELERLRRRYLLRQLSALSTRVAMLSGERFAFDEESQRLYDARSPALDEAQLQGALHALEAALPGEGPLDERLAAFRAQFEIPKERIDPVFRAAIAEARRRTLLHLRLPPNETFKLEYVTGKSWGGYNWYQGNATSLIQINTDLPIHPWRAVDLAAHEGYPGHHVYNVLLEQHLVRDRGWVEFSVYPLFSPQSLIAEGSANYGIDVAFPDASAFARDVLFPLAGLDPSRADDYVQVEELASKLDYAGNEVARRYLDGVFTRDQARDWLVRYALMSPDRAEKRVAFVDTYRSYIINYNVGRDLVRAYVEGRGGTAEFPRRRWEIFRDLLASPRLPSDLRAE